MANDVFGIKQIYPSKVGGQEWTIGSNPESDGRLGSTEETITAQNDYFVVNNLPLNQQKLIAVKTVFGETSQNCNISYNTLNARGYRFNPEDWKNTEFTIFIYPQNLGDGTSDDSNLDATLLTSRTGIRTALANCCDDFGYLVRIYNVSSGSNAGKVEFRKWLRGNAVTTQSFTQALKTHFFRSWTGFKFITYNIPGDNAGEEWTRLEIWMCPTDGVENRENNWTLIGSFVDNGNNLGSGGASCGGTDKQAITWGSIYQHLVYYAELRFKWWSVREIDPSGTFGGGGGSSGGSTGGTGSGVGTIDSNGIQWIFATGQQGVIPKTRNNNNDHRWSGNVSNILGGYEVTAIVLHDGVSSGGHMALKHWGPNHSGSCGNEEDGSCCCWYDCGIRENGDVQTQIERPHPHNEDWDCDECTTDNIGIAMGDGYIGLKWCVYPLLYPGGNADNGGLRLLMWADIDPLDADGRPNNNWTLIYDIIDNAQRDILTDYDVPDEHDVEMRISDTDDETVYGGGLHWRKLRRPEDTQNPPDPSDPGGGTGGGGGLPGGDGDTGGGGTNPDPPTPETLYNDLTIVYNINSDSDGCLCSDPGFTPPDTGGGDPDPGEPPSGGNPGGQNQSVYDIPYTGSGQDEIRLSTRSGSSNHYLQFGEWVRGTNSPLYNKNIKRVDWPLRKSGNPTGTATIVVRKGTDNSIATTVGTIDVSNLTSSFNYQTVENQAASYNMVVGDRLMIEYSGGDSNDYIIAMAKPGISNDSKVTKRDNTMSVGDYRDRDQEAAFRAWA